MELRGKTALITGSGIRLGKAIVKMLAQEGCNVAIHYNRSQKEAEEVRQEALSFGVNAEIFSFDLNDFENLGSLVDAVNEKMGTIDILVNNAANYKKRPAYKPILGY